MEKLRTVSAEKHMPRYYFHVRRDKIIVEDLDGMEFATLEMALAEATKAARHIVAQMILAGNRVEDHHFEIIRADGTVVGIVSFKSAAGLE